MLELPCAGIIAPRSFSSPSPVDNRFGAGDEDIGPRMMTTRRKEMTDSRRIFPAWQAGSEGGRKATCKADDKSTCVVSSIVVPATESNCCPVTRTNVKPKGATRRHSPQRAKPRRLIPWLRKARRCLKNKVNEINPDTAGDRSRCVLRYFHLLTRGEFAGGRLTPQGCISRVLESGYVPIAFNIDNDVTSSFLRRFCLLGPAWTIGGKGPPGRVGARHRHRS